MKKKYYIGLDGHSKNCYFVVLNARGKVVDREKLPTREKDLLSYIRGIDGIKSLIMDETTITQWLYVLLKDEVDSIVVTQSTVHSHAKTDFKEAQEHAENLRVNHVIKKVYHSADNLMELRALVSGYKDLIANIVAEKNRYKALFRQSAIIEAGNLFYTDKNFIKKLRTENQRFVAKPLFDRINLLQKHKLAYEKKFNSNVSKIKEIKLMTSIPGFGSIRANQIVANVVTPYRFKTKYKFFAYCMLVDHIQNSDGNTYGKKRPKGKKDLKEIFKSSRLSVLKGSSAIKLKYELMQANGATQSAAYNALSRTLAALVLGIWKSGKKYDDQKFERVVRKNYVLNKT